MRYFTSGDTITLRVKVTNDERIPIEGLTSKNFTIQIFDDPENPVTLNLNNLKLISSEQSKPDPAHFIILLDLSGSMRNNDESGNTKLISAISGIKNFVTQIQSEKIPVTLSIVPFGYVPSSFNCPLLVTDKNGNPIEIDLSASQSAIAKNLKKINSPDLIEQLDQLASTKDKLCAATNIYQPLTVAVNYLADKFPSKLFEDKKQSKIPRLAVILFSDGHDVFNERSDEEKRFQELTNILINNPQVTVHTMGYGEKLNELRDRINQEKPGSCPLNNSDLTVDNLKKNCTLPGGGDINEYIVDEPRLTEIADKTGGIALFPGNPQEVVETLKDVLKTVREYEIQYQQPGAERAKKYITTVTVKAPDRQLDATSKKEQIRLDNFLFKSPSWQGRLGLLILTLIMGEGGRRYFIKYSQDLQK